MKWRALWIFTMILYDYVDWKSLNLAFSMMMMTMVVAKLNKIEVEGMRGRGMTESSTVTCVGLRAAWAAWMSVCKWRDGSKTRPSYKDYMTKHISDKCSQNNLIIHVNHNRYVHHYKENLLWSWREQQSD